jgi:general L-amino acid transport system permease protein
MAEVLRTEALEPLPVAEPPSRKVPPRRWIRENLFSTWYNSLLTVVLVPLILWVGYQLVQFVVVDGRWEIIRRNVKLLLVFQFPAEQLWRIWVVLLVGAAVFGVAAAVTGKVRAAEVAEGRALPAPRYVTWRRVWPVALLIAILLVLGRSWSGLLLVLGVVLVAVGARQLGRLVPIRFRRPVNLAAVLTPVAAFVFLTGFGGTPWAKWGGLMLTVGLAVGGIVLSFPFGVLLALGRRSSLPAVRVVCVGYVELIRGVPLITLLFLGAFVIGFILPPGVSTPSLQTRALIAIVMFTAAYIAEIVRGGIQSIPRGHFEAAYALGLSTFATTRLIVLPQALRAVIPALVGQFISLFKDTSLVYIIGLTELLGIANSITKQSDFVAQGMIVETLVFASLVYWVGAYSMSRESQRLERRLGVGER